MRKFIYAISALGLCGLAGSVGFFSPKSPTGRDMRPIWTETSWPFPVDQWGAGKAFVCEAADCGTALTLYVRAKIGFCNCKTGVSDDEELERVADKELIDGRTSALGSGRSIAVGAMKGRSRAYAISKPFFPHTSVVTIAINERCDAIVATTLVDNRRPSRIEPAILDFLGSDMMLRWADATLGL
jgi:hypothetical protein